MIHLFDVNNGVVVPTIHCETIEWLRVIKEKFPDNYMKIYCYIYYMSYIGEENPYFNIPEGEKSELIAKDLGINFSLDEDEIDYAIKRATDLYETPTTKFFHALKKSMDKIVSYMEMTSITDGRDGNLAGILSIMKDYSKLRQSYKDVLKDVKEEESINVRGSQQIGYDIERYGDN